MHSLIVNAIVQEMRRQSSKREELPEVTLRVAPPAAKVRAQSVGAPSGSRASDKEGGRQMFDKNELRSMHKELGGYMNL